MDQYTYRVLLGLNPWLNEPSMWPSCSDRYITQDYIPRSTSVSLVPDRVSLIIGPRQAGKSTLIWKTIRDEVWPYIYINCEEQTLQELCSSPVLFLDEIKKLVPQAQGYFFDESQHLREAGLFLKGLADLRSGKPIVATGSSGFHLHAKTRESLAGRAARHILLPLGMAELLPKGVAETVQIMEGQSIWEKLLLWGGYPETVLSKEPQDVLGRLVEAFVLRDASDLYVIKNPQAFRKLLEMSASQIGNLVNYSNFAEVLGVSVNTVSQYLNILEESHILRLLPPFVGGKRAEITSRPKLYFLDNGLRNFLFGGFQPIQSRADIGALMENLVFTELCKNTHPILDSLHFWRSSSQAEVDFILKRGSACIAIEAKAASLNRPKISRSLRSFMKAYGPKQVLVVNTGLQQTETIAGTTVRFLLGHELHEALTAD